MDCNQREIELRRLIERINADGRLPHHPNALMLWRQYRDKDILPRAGGYLEQPDWWQADMAYLDLLNELAAIPHELHKAQKRLSELARKHGVG